MLYQFLEGKVIFACKFDFLVSTCTVMHSIQHKLTLHAVTSLDLWTPQTRTTV